MRRTVAAITLVAGCCAGSVGCGSGGADPKGPSATAVVATRLAEPNGYDYHSEGRPANVVAFLDGIERIEHDNGWPPDTYLTSHREAVAYTVTDGRLACEHLRTSGSFDETVKLYSTGYGPTVYTVEEAAALIATAQLHLCPELDRTGGR